MTHNDTPNRESFDTKDDLARALGHDSYDAAPRVVQNNIDGCWPNAAVGTFGDMVADLADDLEGDA